MGFQGVLSATKGHHLDSAPHHARSSTPHLSAREGAPRLVRPGRIPEPVCREAADPRLLLTPTGAPAHGLLRTGYRRESLGALGEQARDGARRGQDFGVTLRSPAKT